MTRPHFLFRLLPALALCGGAMSALGQDIYAYSEFRRVDPYGEIVPQDRGGRPREILSPLVARNSHFTFRLVVESPLDKYLYLFIGTNPEDVFDIQVYKEMWARDGESWIPDRLLAVDTPYLSHLPDRYHGLPHQKVESFLIDVYIPPHLTPARYKLEPQLNVEGHWVSYPMEIRVSDVTVPMHRETLARLPGIKLPSDSAVMGPLRAYICGEPESGRTATESARRLMRRNVLEDLAIAREREKHVPREEVVNQLLRGLNIDGPTFCAATERGGPLGPEWYLLARNYLHKGSRTWY
jgi:hypothetical protein